MLTSKTISKEEMVLNELKNVFLRRASIKKNKLKMDMKLWTILDENVFKLGHILMDLHETFKLKREYEPLTEFETFTTVEDIYQYILRKI